MPITSLTFLQRFFIFLVPLIHHRYTYTGKICIAVNPYKWLDLYGQAVMQRYCGTDVEDNPPHVYAIAELAYRSMMTVSV
jgi:myosin-5